MLKIYICACKNKFYLKEAKICIDSIRKNGQFNGLIYLLTDIPQFIKELEFNLTNLEVIKVNCKTNKLSAALRTQIFNYIENYDHNDIFLYLDTDIVIVKPLPTFDYIDDKYESYGIRMNNLVTSDIYNEHIIYVNAKLVTNFNSAKQYHK